MTIIYVGDAAGTRPLCGESISLLEEGLNVRVLLLPDGEDPDSFARSHTPQDLADFIANNETDFINFKTKLLLGTAGMIRLNGSPNHGHRAKYCQDSG